ncbi:YceD family protein [Neisseriaceae bacterium B1]
MLNRILIDPQAWAAKGETLTGQVALSDLDERVLSADIANYSATLSYSLAGGIDRWQRPFLDLSLSGSLDLTCQRCMNAMPFALDETVRIVLFNDETQLDDAMLADEELEGMVLEPELDVFSLVEDQLLMALPFVPAHDVCDNADLSAANQDKPNPFAVLAGLKKSA